MSSSASRSPSRSPTSPQLLLADEPTGELDTATSQEVFDALRTANREAGHHRRRRHPRPSRQRPGGAHRRDPRRAHQQRGLRRDAGDGVTHEEYAVMDRAGRVQVPREYREALELTRRVRLALEADHVSVWPDGGATVSAAAGAAVQARGVHRTFGQGRIRGARPARRRPRRVPRRARRARRALRVRQDHAAQSRRRPRPA